MTRRDVLVVGAGPVGLVAACELARHGVPVRLIDRVSGPSQLPRAVGLHARTQDLLDTLGVIGRLSALGRQIATVEARDEHGLTLARLDLHGLPSRYRYVLDVTQRQTEAVLRERAAELGVAIEWGVELRDLRQDGVGVTVTLSSSSPSSPHSPQEQRARFGYLVGADGEHSTVRRLVGADLAGDSPSQRFVIADAEVEGERPTDGIVLVASPEGVAAAAPISADQVRLMFSVPPPHAGGPPITDPPTMDAVRELCARRFGGRLRLRKATWVAWYEARHGQVPHYRYGHTFLAGDAAHIPGPTGGHGMNIGMQDAFNLAWKLALVARGRAHPSLLDSYEAERHPVAARAIGNTLWSAQRASVVSPLGGEAVRRLALAAAGHLGPTATPWTSSLADLTVSYPDSPAVGWALSSGERSTAAPGSHLPPLAGLPTGPGHTVVLRCPDPSRTADLQDVLGSLGTVKSIVDLGKPVGDAVAAHYGVGEDGFVAIRPDDYVGYVAAPATTGALRTYLHDHLRAI